jgi:hypothetical protein
MNEYTINIPINRYDELRLCELQLKSSYILRLLKLSKEYASLDIENRTNDDFSKKVRKQNELLSFLKSEYFEVLERDQHNE